MRLLARALVKSLPYGVLYFILFLLGQLTARHHFQWGGLWFFGAAYALIAAAEYWAARRRERKQA
jgi:hypothetical protein